VRLLTALAVTVVSIAITVVVVVVVVVVVSGLLLQLLQFLSFLLVFVVMLEEDTVECSIAFCIVLVFLRKLAIDLFRKIFFFFFLLLLSGCVCVCVWGGEMRYQERIKIIAVFVAKAFSIMSGGCRQVVRW
jgi:hypothetical protein